MLTIVHLLRGDLLPMMPVFVTVTFSVSDAGPRPVATLPDSAHTETPTSRSSSGVSAGHGTLVVGDPVGVLNNDSGARHNQPVGDWRPESSKRCSPTKPQAPTSP